MAEVVRRRVPVSGQRSVTAPATCAQRHMWRLIQRALPDPAFYNQVYRVGLPPGARADDVLAVLAELVGRYESLRTAFRTAGCGTLVQQVVRDGSFEAELWSAAPGEDPQVLADAWQRRMRGSGFDPGTAPLLRAMVVLAGGVPVLAALCVSHIAADLMSLRVLAGELTRLLAARAAGRPSPPPPASRQPVEQALYEASAEGRQVLERSHRYWRRQLERAPVTMFPHRAAGCGPRRFSSAAMDSRAVAMVLPSLADRCRATTSAVLLGAVSLLLGHRAGLPTCAVRLLVANRFAAGLRGAVANLHQEILTTVDLRGPTVTDVVRGALAASMTAYGNGLYDPDRVEELIHRAGRERGTRLSLSCCFNDVREGRDAPGPAGPVDAAAVRAAMAATTVVPDAFEEAEDFFLVVDDEVPGRLRMVLCADTAVLPPEEVQAFLLGVERLLVEFAVRELRPEEAGPVSGLTSTVHRPR
ncbi:condensation domain-containing protein [Streptomyces sp. NPDC026206]|uniref:condensation domain-containing protein n=1 Tax=Streptomyces sp. NPDC026206 TaxID=3157089 RepID=UPI0034031D13